jgi:hypothetical protein
MKKQEESGEFKGKEIIEVLSICDYKHKMVKWFILEPWGRGAGDTKR